MGLLTPEEARARRYREIAGNLRDFAASAKSIDIRNGFLILADGYDRLAVTIELADTRLSSAATEVIASPARYDRH